jgi:hypothetical protein
MTKYSIQNEMGAAFATKCIIWCKMMRHFYGNTNLKKILILSQDFDAELHY